MNERTITIKITPYEHEDDRRVEARVKRLMERFPLVHDDTFEKVTIEYDGGPAGKVLVREDNWTHWQ